LVPDYGTPHFDEAFCFGFRHARVPAAVSWHEKSPPKRALIVTPEFV
jgi:hypothetical protein